MNGPDRLIQPFSDGRRSNKARNAVHLASKGVPGGRRGLGRGSPPAPSADWATEASRGALTSPRAGGPNSSWAR